MEENNIQQNENLGTTYLTKSGIYDATMVVNITLGRDMPLEWIYYKNLKIHPNDHALLFFSDGGNDGCIFTSAVGYEHYIFGGNDGKQPLYKFVYGTGWYNHNGTSWELNLTQPDDLTEMDLRYCDLDVRPAALFTTWSDLTGKYVNDEKIGETELFTVVIHDVNNAVPSVLLKNHYIYGDSTCAVNYYTMLAASVKSTFKDANSYDKIYTNWFEFMEIEEGADEVGEYMCANCVSMQKIIVPSSVKNIRKYAFAKCTTLADAMFLGKVDVIEENAFYNCSAAKRYFG